MQSTEARLADNHDNLLRYGAALITRWNTLQTELQRELFDDAGSMGALLDTATLRSRLRAAYNPSLKARAPSPKTAAVPAADGLNADTPTVFRSELSAILVPSVRTSP